jgi:hypothetical protein
MNSRTTPSPTSSPATGWDRVAVVLLGAIGFALSYDALRQMAAAAHIRTPLTYAFPLAVDGFIAYGVRALLVLRRAPFLARAYAWTLFTAATAASVWANALHAIRLNHQPHPAGLHLTDTVVAALSVTAPLALAGAVHLYILITRHAAPTPHETPASGSPQPTGLPESHVASPASDQPSAQREPTARQEPPTHTEPSGSPAPTSKEHAGQVPDRNSGRLPVTRPVGRPAGASMDELVLIGRQARRDSGRLSRTVVNDAVRARGISLSSDRLTAVMDRLREEDAAPSEQLALP